MTPPFVIYALPRSRTYWLSRFLTYGGAFCGHDQARFIRSIDDVKSWLSMNATGSAETAAAPWWRLARHYRPDLKIVVVRRDPRAVIDSLMRFGLYDKKGLLSAIARLDRALDSAARAPGALQVTFADLRHEQVCATIFEHCLDKSFDAGWWAELSADNLQIDLKSQLNYVRAHWPQISAAAKSCAREQRSICLKRQAAAEPDADGVVIQEESFQDWWRDGQALIAEHCVAIGEAPDAALRMNLPVWERITRAGVVQIITARLNGRMLGYLTAFIAPSLEHRDVMLATQISFFVTKDAAGLRLGRKLQSGCIDRARRRGVTKMYMRAGKRGVGERLGALYERMGAQDFGQLYELDISQ